MLPPRNSPWRGILIVGLIYVIDFILHIIFAAKGWDLAFRIIAWELALLSICFAPCALLFGGSPTHDEGLEVIRLGTWIAIPLTMGYFWAINGMQWSTWLIGSAAIPLMLRVVWYPGERWLSTLLYSALPDEEE